MKKIKFTIMICAMAIIAGCQKNTQGPTQNKEDGRYSGFLIMSGFSIKWQPDSVHVSLENGKYKSETFLNKLNQNDIGSVDGGNFAIAGDSIHFDDNIVQPLLADVYLTGAYRMTIKSDSLILTRNDQGILYTYRLKKQ